MEIGIGAIDLDRLVPHYRLEALLGLPVEFDEGRFALGVDEAEGVDAEAFHRAEGARDRAVRHHPHDHMEALGHQAHEIPEIVVGRLRLREGSVGLGLHRMHEVGEFHRILDEEDRDIVADEIPIAFLGVELHRETAHVACEVERAFRTRDGREAHEGGRALADALEDVGAADVGKAVGELEMAVRAIAARMNDALGDALMVEVEDLLAEMEILEQRRAARALLEAVLVVGDRHAMLGSKRRMAGARLMRLAAATTILAKALCDRSIRRKDWRFANRLAAHVLAGDRSGALAAARLGLRGVRAGGRGGGGGFGHVGSRFV